MQEQQYMPSAEANVWGLWCRGRQSPSWVSLYAPLACLLHGDIKIARSAKEDLEEIQYLAQGHFSGNKRPSHD